MFRHSKAGELCERFPFLYRVKEGEIVGEYSTYRGWPMLSIKGQNGEIGQECRRNTALYDVSRKYTRCSRSCRACTKRREENSRCRFRTLVYPLVQTEEILVSLDELKGIVNVDAEKMVAEVWAGTKLHELGKLLEEKGYAQENLGILIRNLLQERLVQGLMARGLPLEVYQHKL